MRDGRVAFHPRPHGRVYGVRCGFPVRCRISSLIIAIATDGLDAMALMVWPALDASTVDVARPSGPMHVYISIFQPLVSGGLAQFAEDIAGKSLIS